MMKEPKNVIVTKNVNRKTKNNDIDISHSFIIFGFDFNTNALINYNLTLND